MAGCLNRRHGVDREHVIAYREAGKRNGWWMTTPRCTCFCQINVLLMTSSRALEEKVPQMSRKEGDNVCLLARVFVKGVSRWILCSVVAENRGPKIFAYDMI